MKKVKYYTSFLKERDWLEEMATQGWLLTDIKLGIIYYFKEIPPCEKVYELERFAISANPTISELTARSNAIELAKEFGGEKSAGFINGVLGAMERSKHAPEAEEASEPEEK